MSSVELRKAGVSRWLARGSHLRHGARPVKEPAKNPVKKKAQVVEVDACPRCGITREKWERGTWKWTDDIVTFFHLRCSR